MLISIGTASEIIGVSISTLRRWEKEGLFEVATRTLGNHRRYCIDKIKNIFNIENDKPFKSRKNICYSRVSSHDQKNDLETQCNRLINHCKKQQIPAELIRDLGSGINFKKPGFKKIIHGICHFEIEQIIVTHRDRLIRFGFPLIEFLCKIYDVKLTVLEETEVTFQEEVVRDVIEIMTVCSARIYGKRSHQNAKCA